MSQPLNSVSTHALAYLGDSVLEVCVRKYLVDKGIGSSGALNREALNFVRAGAQAAAVQKILPLLTEEETSAFHRGRNLGHSKTPKSASAVEYRSATGMEALFGYLYMKGETDRITELFYKSYELD